MEDEKGVKITSPLIVVPPAQRIEPSAIGQVKIQGMPALASLPRIGKPFFITTCAKFRRKATSPIRCKSPCKRASKFLPPAGAIENRYAASWQYKITLQRQGNGYQVSNPTGYYVVLSNASNRMDGTPARGFSPLVIAPKSNVTLGGDASELGHSPVLTYVNDYGARLPLIFNCTDNSCAVDEAKSRKS